MRSIIFLAIHLLALNFDVDASSLQPIAENAKLDAVKGESSALKLGRINRDESSTMSPEPDSCPLTYLCTDSEGNPVPVAGFDTSGTKCCQNSGNGVCQLRLTNPENAPAYPIYCRATFKKPSEDICQVRLDFLEFNMSPPSFDGDCNVDSFTLAGADNLQKFTTCGFNEGQHLYLEYGIACVLTANIILNSSSSVFDIAATFIPCSGGVDQNGTAVDLAPAGCAQYFTSAIGEVRSFNEMPAGSGAFQQQINSERYSVCVRSPQGATTIKWTPCSSSSFCISGKPWSPTEHGDCPTDYVDIPGSEKGRYCGCTPAPSITSNLKPFSLYVNLDDSEVPGADLPVDTSTGCPLGFECLDSFGLPVGPSGPLCSSPESGLMCSAGEYISSITDIANSGFCLRYVVS